MAKILFLVSIVLLSSYTSVTETHTLKAGENVDPNSVEEEHLMLSGTREVEAATKSKMLYKTHHPRNVLDDLIPKEFDARKHWPQCKTIGEVLNDGNTHWSWAYAITGAFADRMCIATNGRYNQLLSTEELISCSGINTREEETIIGSVDHLNVWEYLKSHGLVSGGKYNTNDGCQPSKIVPIGNLSTNVYKNACETRCYGDSRINYNHDHVKVSNNYQIPYEYIQKEVQNYGPVSVQFRVYDDFFYYKSGVYAKTENSKFVRWQYVKLIGWGVEDGVDYWLLVNSWGNEWGHNGLFKMKRGTNEYEIEKWAFAGQPDLCQIYDTDLKFCKEDGEEPFHITFSNGKTSINLDFLLNLNFKLKGSKINIY